MNVLLSTKPIVCVDETRRPTGCFLRKETAAPRQWWGFLGGLVCYCHLFSFSFVIKSCHTLLLYSFYLENNLYKFSVSKVNKFRTEPQPPEHFYFHHYSSSKSQTWEVIASDYLQENSCDHILKCQDFGYLICWHETYYTCTCSPVCCVRTIMMGQIYVKVGYCAGTPC